MTLEEKLLLVVKCMSNKKEIFVHTGALYRGVPIRLYYGESESKFTIDNGAQITFYIDKVEVSETPIDQANFACPFCGWGSLVKFYENKWYVTCVNHECRARTKEFFSAQDAISAWNKRLFPDEMEKLRVAVAKQAVLINNLKDQNATQHAFAEGVDEHISDMLDAMRPFVESHEGTLQQPGGLNHGHWTKLCGVYKNVVKCLRNPNL